EVTLRHPEVVAVKPGSGNARYELQFTVPESHRCRPIAIEMSYCWAGAGTLTQPEVEALQHEGPAYERLRQDGLEFSTIWAPAPLASAELMISLPSEYAPQDVDVRVAQDPGGEDCPSEAAELRTKIRVLAAGVYSLRIPFPRTNREYTL